MVEGPILLVILVLSVAWIIFATAKLNLNAFLALLVAAFFAGIASGMELPKVVNTITSGFGGILGYIGIVIFSGTIIGTLLEKSGGAFSIANSFLKVVGKKYSSLVMAVTGAVVSIPVFCDSGFVILSSLNRALAEMSKKTLAIFSVALAGGLYTTHVFVPPTPGPIAAAGIIGADLGLVILMGIIVSIPGVIIAWQWGERVGKKFDILPQPEYTIDELKDKYGKIPSATKALLPILVPIILISLKSIAEYPTNPMGTGFAKDFFSFIGDPATALIIGIFIGFWMVPKLDKEVVHDWVGEGIKNAALIIAITGAGGAFGEILKTTPIGDYLGSTLAGYEIGIIVAFILAAALKTSLGSSTVAIITSASLMAPLLDPLGLTGQWAKVFVVLAIGAGSMTVSHANDSYFWIIAKFSDMETDTAYVAWTLSTLALGVVSIIWISILHALIG